MHLPPKAELLPALFNKMVEEAPRIPDIYNRAIRYFLTIGQRKEPEMLNVYAAWNGILSGFIDGFGCLFWPVVCMELFVS